MNSARQRCYDEIREMVRAHMLDYYQHHPEIVGDDRSQRAISESMIGLKNVFKILDRYDVLEKDTPSMWRFWRV